MYNISTKKENVNKFICYDAKIIKILSVKELGFYRILQYYNYGGVTKFKVYLTRIKKDFRIGYDQIKKQLNALQDKKVIRYERREDGLYIYAPQKSKTFILEYKYEIERMSNMNITAHGLYVILKSYANIYQKCFPSIKTLCNASGLSRRNVIYILNEFERNGFIYKHKRDMQSTIYEFVPYNEEEVVGIKEIAFADFLYGNVVKKSLELRLISNGT